MGFSKDNLKGVLLALLSSGFIGASFIIKKKGLRKAAAASGVRAGDLFIYLFRFFLQISVFLSRILIFWNGCSLIFVGYGGYSYLLEPLWWVGFITSKFSCLFFHFLLYVLIFQKPTYSLQIVVIWNFIVIVLIVDMDSKLWLFGLLSSSTFHFAIEFKCFSMAIILLHRGSFVSVWF